MKLRTTPHRRVPAPCILLGVIISATIVLTASADLTNCTPPPSGLVSWWSGEGNANDIAGTNNGTLPAGITFTNGVVGQAFNLNGLSQYVDVGNPSNLNPAASFSIEGWIYPRQDRAQVIMSKWADSPAHSNQRSYVFQTYPGQVLLFGISDWAHQWDVSFENFYTTNNVFVLNTWSHVAAVYDQAAGARRLYVNGVRVAERIDAPITVTNSTAEVVIGAALTYGPADSYFDGLIDELSFYAKALSAAEIQAIYNAGSAGKCAAGMAPSITAQPASQVVLAEATATFTVTATGTPPLSYQWRFGGTNIAGATGTSLTLSNVQPAQAGSYDVQVSNAYGSTNSVNAILTVTSSPCAPPPSGLVAWWPAEGNANDRIGANDGTLRGGATFATGEVGQAFNFDGVSGSVMVPDAPALHFTNAMTVEAWVNPKAIGGHFQEIISKWFGAGNQLSFTTSITPQGQAYLLVSSDGQTSVLGGDYMLVYTTNSIPANHWTHFAATYDGALLKVYLNGAFENQVPWTNGIFPGTGPLFIGEDYSESLFNGLIDEASLYSRALSDAEIQAIYSAEAFGKCPPVPPSITGQPSSQTVLAGASATFTVTAAGTPPFNYQWGFNGTNIAGATGTSLTLSNVQPPQAGIYAVRVTNPYGSTNSANAILTVTSSPCAPPPSGMVGWWRGEGNALDQVGSNNGALFNGAGFDAGVVGQDFRFSGSNNSYVEVADSPALRLTNAVTVECWARRLSTSDKHALVEKGGDWTGGQTDFEIGLNDIYPGGSHFDFEFGGGGRSCAVTLDTAWHHYAAVAVSGQPDPVLYIDGVSQPIIYRVGVAAVNLVASTRPLHIGAQVDSQTGWSYFSSTMIDELAVFNRALSASEIQAIYQAGSAGKCLAGTAPSITSQPASQTLLAGATATFTVTAAGTPPLSYQWAFNGTNIAGATGASLSLSNVQGTQAGSYWVVVTNAYGTVTSSVVVLTVNPAPTCTPAPAGLVAWWQAEGNALDSFGANNGTLQGGVTYAAGEVGKAFSFNGINGSVLVPDAPALRCTNALTVEAWIYPKSVGSAQGILLKWFGNGNQLAYSTAIETTGQAYLLVSKNGLGNTANVDYKVVYSTHTVPLNQWTHFAGVYDGTWLKVYLNGVLEGQAQWTNGIFPGTAPLLIGEALYQSPFNGLIDEPSVYARALTDAEIHQIYNAGSLGKCGLPPVILAQPQSQTTKTGDNVAFIATAAGTPPLAYQWVFNGTNIAGATAANLGLTSVQGTQAGNYVVMVANAYGAVTSSIAVLTVNPPPPCTPAPAGLVAWWPAEGNALDSFGTNHGALQGGVTYVAGEVGKAFSFNGVNGSVLVPDAPALRCTNALTVEAWIYPKSSGPAQGILLKWFGNGNQLAYSTAIETTGQAYLLVSKNGLGVTRDVDYKVVYSTHTVPRNQWTHFAGVYDGAWMKVYLNGVLENQAPWTNGIYPGTAPLVIGEALYQSPFNGLIDEPSVYNRALSDAEIQQIYSAGSAGKCLSGTAPSITSQPASQTVLASSTVTFTVTATGTPPLGYQWSFDGTNIAAATGTSLTLSNVQPAQAGSYSVVVTNAYGVVTSSIALLTVNPAPPCTPAPAGLVSWWQADGFASDTLGGNDGILVNGAGFAPGEVGQAFSFDGVNEYVKIPKAASLDAPNQLTIDFWMKADIDNPIGSRVEGLVTSDFYAFEIGTSASTPGVLFSVSTDNGGHYVNTSDINGTGAVFPAGEWHHIAGVYDGAKVQLYLDGQAQGKPAPVTGQISPMLANSFVAIGSSDGRTTCGSCVGARCFKGQIDEVDIFNRALSASEVAAVYAAGASGKCLTPSAPFIYVQPANQVVTVGGSVTFNVGVAGTPPLSYQWSYGGSALGGATNAALTLTNVQFSQAGNYSVVITNVAGTASSSNATLSVNFPPAAVRVVNVSNARSGTTVNVPVSLAANGNENGLSFSLNFDTTRLTYVSTALGSGSSGATLLTNATLAASGKLGVMLALPPDRTFAAGAQELVQVTFMTAVRTAAFSTTVSFGDVPIVRQLSDAPGNVLAATYASGVVWIQAADLEGDISPRPDGDKAVTLTDWVTAGRYAARLDYPTNAAEFQQADCAPRATLGDGEITVIDWVQVGLYAAQLDPLTVAGGPTNEVGPGGLVSGPGSTPVSPHDVTCLLEVADTMVVQGFTGTASVQLESLGNENALGFSLSFDPSVLNYVSSSSGSAGNGVTLFVNDSQAGTGRLGFVLGLGTGKTFVSGTRELVKVTFRAAATAKGNYPVSFGAQPVVCEVSGANALRLAAGYANGAITVNPLPSLSIGRSGEDITLAWPLWATNFVLQAAVGGLSPTVPWTNVMAVPKLTSNQAIVNLPLATTNLFYRLHQH